jgi:alkylation response protein AidB-like acyl-CoA dehydrogenase
LVSFSFTPEQDALRAEVRAFLRDNLPADFSESPIGTEWSGDEEELEIARAFNKRLAARGWLTAHWPTAYGGLGLSVMEQVILNEELAYRGAPILNVNGLRMLAPILMLYGSDAQKAEHLPGIAQSEVMWAQGYSEPNAGSDLGSLQMTATRDGDGYRLNGAKIWTGHGLGADWIFVLARTDPQAPKHKGISFFLLPMKSPGLTVTPIPSMTGHIHFCQEYFENVWVPAENRVGDEGQGWYIGAALLDFERSGADRAARVRRTLERISNAFRDNHEHLHEGGRPVRLRLAEHWIEYTVGRSLSYRVAGLQQRGSIPNYEASIVKVFFTELVQRVAHTGVATLGLPGLLSLNSYRAPLGGAIGVGIETALIGTIGGGTSEVQRNIIANRGLRLPRG